MSLRLHWSPDSANLVVRITLEALDLPFEGVRINRGKGEHKRPGYLALNPQGLIPVLQDRSGAVRNRRHSLACGRAGGAPRPR